MLTIKDIEEFEQYLRSGRLENDFEYGSETERHAILELLQKFMDTADVVDEKASKIIYKGLQKPGPQDKKR